MTDSTYMSPDPDLRERHDEIPAEHLKERVQRACPACFHIWLAPKTEPDGPCPKCKHNPNAAQVAIVWPPPSPLMAYGPARLDPVLQPWVMQLPWKMQSILFSSLRGPDQEYLISIKQYSKWMRSVTQNNADPSKPYMAVEQSLPEVESLYKELEHCPCHFVHHFLDGMAIVAYHHPDESTAIIAAKVHYQCAEELFHFYPEPPCWFEVRHRDKRGGVDLLRETWTNFEHSQKHEYFEAVHRRFRI